MASSRTRVLLVCAECGYVRMSEPRGKADPPTDRTLGGLVQSMRDYLTAIDFCNAQLDALRSFFKTR